MPNETQMGKVRKKELWLCGQFMKSVNSLSDSKNTNERSYERFGFDDNLQDVDVVDGQLTVRALTTKGGVQVQHQLMGRNPNNLVTGLALVSGDELSLPAWFNFRNADDTKYEKSKYYGLWSPSVLPEEQGGANDTSLPEFMGRTQVPIEFNDAFVACDKQAAASGSTGYTATFTAGFILPPGRTEYALDVLAISGTGNGPLKWARLSRGAQLVASNGAITVGPDDYADVPSDWGGITSLWAAMVYTGSGTAHGNNLPVTADSMWA